MGKRSRKHRAAAPQITPAESLPGRVKQSWQVAGQSPTAKARAGGKRGGAGGRRARPERPRSMFGPLPELLILAGVVLVIVGMVTGTDSVASEWLIVGVFVAGAGVVEICAREHFTGFRSHTLLLALLVALGVHGAYVLAVGDEGIRRVIVLVIDLAVFGAGVFWLRQVWNRQRHG